MGAFKSVADSGMGELAIEYYLSFFQVLRNIAWKPLN